MSSLIYGISRDGSKNYNIRTCEHVILGQLWMGARQTNYAPLKFWEFMIQFVKLLIFINSLHFSSSSNLVRARFICPLELPQLPFSPFHSHPPRPNWDDEDILHFSWTKFREYISLTPTNLPRSNWDDEEDWHSLERIEENNFTHTLPPKPKRRLAKKSTSNIIGFG